MIIPSIAATDRIELVLSFSFDGNHSFAASSENYAINFRTLTIADTAIVLKKEDIGYRLSIAE